MSAGADFPTRLYWVGLKGVARWHGQERRLEAPPHLPGLAIEGIDYIPGQLAQVMPRHQGWRDMVPAEIELAGQLLRRLASG